MAVNNISICNSVLNSKIGAELIEARNITIKNTRLLAKQSNPLIYIENSNSIFIDSMKYESSVDLLFKVNGNRNGNINVLNVNTANVKKRVELTNDAPLGTIEFK